MCCEGADTGHFVTTLACEQALLFGQAKRRELARRLSQPRVTRLWGKRETARRLKNLLKTALILDRLNSIMRYAYENINSL